MKKIGISLFSFGIIGILVFVSVGEKKIPELSANIFTLANQAKEAGLDKEAWQEISIEAKKIPRIFPLSLIRKSFLETEEIVLEIHQLKESFPLLFAPPLSTEKILDEFKSLERVDNHLKKISKNLNKIPDFLLTEQQNKELTLVQAKIRVTRRHLNDIQKFKNIFSRVWLTSRCCSFDIKYKYLFIIQLNHFILVIYNI
jgi:Sec-independent protein translocase protein TatA